MDRNTLKTLCFLSFEEYMMQLNLLRRMAKLAGSDDVADVIQLIERDERAGHKRLMDFLSLNLSAEKGGE